MNTSIILLHGLGSHPITLWPLEKYLNYRGFTNTYNIPYPVDSFLTIEESTEYVAAQIRNIGLDDNEIIVIGQSMGGVIANNLHTTGLNIKLGIYIGSPLHGARLLNQLDNLLPETIKKYFRKPPYDILMEDMTSAEPPHPYNTISLGWFNTGFDGCVYKNEAVLNPDNNNHLAWADHRSIFANPRLWWKVADLIEA